MSRDIPIIFSGPMVRGLIRQVEHPGTGKTNTRRLLYGKNGRPTIWGAIQLLLDRGTADHRRLQRTKGVRVGDRLWVRENWRTDCPDDPTGAIYQADQAPLMPPGGKWRPSIHMPRWASRLTLTVTAIRIEKLHDITETGSQAEGVAKFPAPFFPDSTYRRGFENIWRTLHGQESWQANPDVVALTFTVRKENIDG